MSGLSTKQNKAIMELVGGKNHRQAADVVGVTERTIHRWMADDTFSTELRRRMVDATSDATRHLNGLLSIAGDVLHEVMVDASSPPSVRVRAAKVVIDSTIRLIETTEILPRLEALEAAMASSAGTM